MNLEQFKETISNFETERLVQALEHLDLEKWIHNPWFLAGVGVFALVALIMKWRLLLATVVCVVGFAGLLQYTVKQGTDLTGLNNQGLLIFVAGGGLIAVIFIYLVFIKSE